MALYQVKNHSSANPMDSTKTTIMAASLQLVLVAQLSEQQHFTITKRISATTAMRITTPTTRNPDTDVGRSQEPHIPQQQPTTTHTPLTKYPAAGAARQHVHTMAMTTATAQDHTKQELEVSDNQTPAHPSPPSTAQVITVALAVTATATATHSLQLAPAPSAAQL